MKLIQNQNVVLRKIHGSFFLINIVDHYEKNRCILFEINEIGAFIWNNLDAPRNAEEIAVILQKALAEPVELSLLEEDIEQFTSQLRNIGFLEDARNG